MGFQIPTHYCTALEQWVRAKLCGVEHTAPPIFRRATITLGIGPHSSLVYVFICATCHLFVEKLHVLCSGIAIFDWQKIVVIGTNRFDDED